MSMVLSWCQRWWNRRPRVANVPRRVSSRPRLEPLEDRCLPAVTIQIDYSFDTSGFFSSQTRRDLLQQAANMIASRFADSLSAISPSGGDTWTAIFSHPGTGSQQAIDNLVVPADTIVVFAGGRNLFGAVGEGGPGGFSASGSSAFLDSVAGRGQAGALSAVSTDFGPWGGAITFDTGTNWHFGATTTGLDGSETDFLSVAVHELTHLLGFGTAESWDALISGASFVGPRSVAEFDGVGNVPLSFDLGHWAEGTLDGGVETAMDPDILDGTRKLLTSLDFAGLDDVGWTLVEPPGQLQFSASAFSVNENGGSVTITVNRVNGGGGIVAVGFAVSNGTAVSGADYTATSGVLTFNPGDTSETFTITILDDAILEGNETVNLTLTNPTGGATLGTPSTATLTINENEQGAGQLQLSAPRFRVDENGGNVLVTVTRTGGSAGAVSVDFALSDGAAFAGLDFTSSTGTLNFADGETSQTIVIPITNDALKEADETFNITLSNPTGGAILGNTTSSVVTILDNDPVRRRVSFELTSSSSDEEPFTIARVAVRLSRPSTGIVTVNFTLTGGTAGFDDHFVFNRTLIFQPGQTVKRIKIVLASDFLDEENETIEMTLSNARGARLGLNTVHAFTILDNDGL